MKEGKQQIYFDNNLDGIAFNEEVFTKFTNEFLVKYPDFNRQADFTIKSDKACPSNLETLSFDFNNFSLEIPSDIFIPYEEGNGCRMRLYPTPHGSDSFIFGQAVFINNVVNFNSEKKTV